MELLNNFNNLEIPINPHVACVCAPCARLLVHASHTCVQLPCASPMHVACARCPCTRCVWPMSVPHAQPRCVPHA